MNVTNLFILETVRRHYLKEYEGIVTNTGPATDGWMRAPSEPGLGVDLHPSVLSRSDVVVQNIVGS